MAKHFSAWVIVTGATPTAFRSRYREDLLPTLHQLQRKQPDVRLAWFERNRFWDSPEAARAALAEKQKLRDDRGRDWRPGGEHKDPRARYELSRDEKRAKFKKRMQRDFADGRRRTPGDEGGAETGSRTPDSRSPGRRDSDNRGPDQRRPWTPKPPGSGGTDGGSRRPRRWSGEGSGPRESGPGRPHGRTGGRPIGKPGGSHGGKAGGSHGGRSGAGPGGRSGGGPGGKPGGRPGGGPRGKTGGRTGGWSGGRSGGRPGGKPGDRPGGKPGGRKK